ncbi:MAG TPA: M20 family metallopeptidase [Pyrinomonadaceae bacterium]|nr:M20 family metallopeptidase [Pyrinomonadaceae bacterium]
MQNQISTELLRDLQARFQDRQSEILSLVRSLVETESPSGDESGSREVVNILSRAAETAAVVGSIERVDVPGLGQHLIIRAFQEKAAAGTLLLVGHTDTVHPRGSIKDRPWRQRENGVYGPGIFDMKANCALAVALLHVCGEFKLAPHGGLTVALLCDEEVGSASGWPLLKSIVETDNVSQALVLEPPAAGGAVKTGRKGTGIFEMRVNGRAAHAGLEPQKGASAILELAKQIARLDSLNGSGNGININVGVVHGGTRSNVVAAEARAEIDVRFATSAEGKAVSDFLRNSVPFDERVRVTVTGGINRPPLERNEPVLKLYELARAIAAALDYQLAETQVGGASDGNFLAALGLPVLDGLGIDGDGAHAEHEHIIVDDIPRRGALLAGLIASL